MRLSRVERVKIIEKCVREGKTFDEILEITGLTKRKLSELCKVRKKSYERIKYKGTVNLIKRKIEEEKVSMFKVWQETDRKSVV